MIKSYVITHIMPDKSRKPLGKVRTTEDVKFIVESTKYPGTWITNSRKLLRYGRGEIQVEEVIEPAKVLRHHVITVGSYKAYELEIINHDVVKRIRLDDRSMTIYGEGMFKLWETNSFTKLCDYVDKEVAYQCFKYYEMLLDQFKLRGAM